MHTEGYKEARKSLFILALILIAIALFYLFVSMFTSMGYKSFRARSAAVISDKVIIIDAGHGGEDPGAEANGLVEKELNLKVAKSLAELLRCNGYKVLLTRDSDEMLYNRGQEDRKKYYDLYNRVLLAKSTDNAIFISIHMNKFPLESCSGLQTFYSENLPESRLLAEKVQSSAAALQPGNKREIKPGGKDIFVLDKATVPSILVECGFISNNEESKMLADDDYLKILASAIGNGITDYLKGTNAI